jgi:dCMP deaminase
MIDIVRPSQHDYYLGLAVAVSWRGSCQTRKVGAVLVRDNRIISTGRVIQAVW